MIRLALRMGRVMSPPSRIEGLLTQWGFLALNVWPPARDYVAQMKYKPPPRFHAGFLIPDGRGRASIIGRLLPQPLVRRADGSEVLLDAVLGNRFGLMLRGPAAGFAPLRQPIWDRLGAARVAMVPGGEAADAGEGEGVEVVTEANDAAAGALAPYANHALLLRPDHYVAAAIPLDDPDSAARAVETLLAATWSGAGAGDRQAA